MDRLPAMMRGWLRREGAWPRVRTALLHPYTLLAAAAFGVWLPRGFNIGPVNDCWFQLAAVMGEGGLIRDSLTRAFGAIPMWLGMHLGNGGFQGVQLVMLLMAWLRGVLFLEIVRRLLPGRALIALAAGLIALFPFSDNSYFWLGASGLQFSLVTALAACLCAIEYLERPRRSALLATVLFQLLAAFTYPGFMPLMSALPIGAWWLMRIAGRRVSPWRLAWINLALVAAGLVTFVLLLTGGGRNAKVLELSMLGFFKGYAWAGDELLVSPLRVFLESRYGAPMVVLCALYAWKVAMTQPSTRDAGRRLALRYWGWLIAGLLALAVLSYLPYAFTTVRYSENRALLGAGIFFYTAVACGLFLLLERVKWRHAAPLAVLVLAGMVVMNGLQKREVWVHPYRAQEALLSAVAREAPRPVAGSFVLVRLQDAYQAKDVQGFYGRELAFGFALQYMYGDLSLTGGFYGYGADRVEFQAAGLQPRDKGYRLYHPGEVAYSDLIVLDYPRDRPVHILTPAELASDAGVKTGKLPGYAPPAGDAAPASSARMCRMLEERFRPSYCPQ